jgi:hypothetical protein
MIGPEPPKAVALPTRPPTDNPQPGKWQFLASARSSQVWDDQKAYSVYSDGAFDLSKARWMRITFGPSRAGTKFLLRLLPKGADFNKPIGVRWEPISIPASSVVELPLKAKEFGLTPQKMGQLVQIAILSGDNAWGRSLGQDASSHAYFEKIEVQ